jgi:hypothetical protein
MSSNAELHLTYKVANAPLNMFPYPHFYVRDAFPEDYYAALRASLPDPAEMKPIEEVRPVRGYKERFVMELDGPQVALLPEQKRAFWTSLRGWMVGGRFGDLVLAKFAKLIDQRFNDPNPRFYDEALLIEDITNYSLGPHTDTPRKVLSFLFYLPQDDSQRHLGTSIYLPKDPAFRCAGGPHYPHDRFDRMLTVPFLPNSLFAFFKDDHSFHGVEPVTDPDCRRWLLLYDIYAHEPPGKKAQLEPVAEAAPRVNFSF